jgi:hypothetical protein
MRYKSIRCYRGSCSVALDKVETFRISKIDQDSPEFSMVVTRQARVVGKKPPI